MQPLIQAHTAGPRPLAGAGGAESILQRPGTLSAPGGSGSGWGVPTGAPARPRCSVGVWCPREPCLGESKSGVKCCFWKKLRGSKFHLHLVLKEGFFWHEWSPRARQGALTRGGGCQCRCQHQCHSMDQQHRGVGFGQEPGPRPAEGLGQGPCSRSVPVGSAGDLLRPLLPAHGALTSWLYPSPGTPVLAGHTRFCSQGTRGGGSRRGAGARHPVPIAFALRASWRKASRRGSSVHGAQPHVQHSCRGQSPLPSHRGHRPHRPRGQATATRPSPFLATASGHCRRGLPGASAEPDSPRSKMAAPVLP